ncbi:MULTISPECIES: DNA-directed RNA polymerase subunit omega [Clostridium]|uniref:DNA-directed RNA polymerase subunit omega n=1 Tax=Clostridium TaxID=1485 RepID=UPI000287A668|nr:MULTISPECIES: DNA-directed RNA polymerase subunit omega [Clostridium]MDF2503210.1 rpoZ [Clostridium sp.]
MNNSMINPSIVDLVKKTGDRYSVVVVTSKRARQIIGGAKPLVDIDANKPLTIAINELDQDKFTYDTIKKESK